MVAKGSAGGVDSVAVKRSLRKFAMVIGRAGGYQICPTVGNLFLLNNEKTGFVPEIFQSHPDKGCL